jgi:hypothetical protein
VHFGAIAVIFLVNCKSVRTLLVAIQEAMEASDGEDRSAE